MKNPFLRTGLAGLFALACSLPLFAAAPVWWGQRGVLTSGATPEDYSAANLGQVKRIATLARDEFQARLPGGAGTAINTLVDSWAQPPAPGVTRNDYAAINQGQLKALVKLFYDRLAYTVSYSGQPLTGGQTYPWSATTSDDSDYAIANLGQVKQLFSFELAPYAVDTDSDGIPDWWEMHWAGTLTILSNPNADPDADGVTNAQAYAQGISPFAGGLNLDFERGWAGWTRTGTGATVTGAVFQGSYGYHSADPTTADTNTLTSLPFKLSAGTTIFSAQIGGGKIPNDYYMVLINASTGAEIRRLYRERDSGWNWELRSTSIHLAADTYVFVRIVDNNTQNWAITVDDIRFHTLPATFSNFDFEQGAVGWASTGHDGQFGGTVSDSKSAPQGSYAYQTAVGTGTLGSTEESKTNELYSGIFTLTAGDKLFSGQLFSGSDSTLYAAVISATTGQELCRLGRLKTDLNWEQCYQTFTLATPTAVYLKIVDKSLTGHIAVDALSITDYVFENFGFEKGWAGWTPTRTGGRIYPSAYEGAYSYHSAEPDTTDTNTLTSLKFTLQPGAILFSAQLGGGNTTDYYTSLINATTGVEIARLRRIRASAWDWELRSTVINLTSATEVYLKIVDNNTQNWGNRVDDIRFNTLPTTFTNFDFEQGWTGWTNIGHNGQLGGAVSDGKSAAQGSYAYQTATGTGTLGSPEESKTSELYSGIFTLTAGDKLFSGQLFSGSNSTLYVAVVSAATGQELCKLSRLKTDLNWEQCYQTFTLTASTAVYLKIVDQSATGHIAADALSVSDYVFDNFGFERGWAGWTATGSNGAIYASAYEGTYSYHSGVPTTAGTNTLTSLPFTVNAGTVVFSAQMGGGNTTDYYMVLINAATGAEIARLRRIRASAWDWELRSTTLNFATATSVYLRLVDNNTATWALRVDDIRLTPQ